MDLKLPPQVAGLVLEVRNLIALYQELHRNHERVTDQWIDLTKAVDSALSLRLNTQATNDLEAGIDNAAQYTGVEADVYRASALWARGFTALTKCTHELAHKKELLKAALYQLAVE